LDPLSISLPPRPPKAERPAEPAPPLTFNSFVEAVAELLKGVRARVEQRQEDPEGASWWLSFNRASCLYRLTNDRRASTLVLEKGQGSFVPNTPPTWRVLDSRPQEDPSFESTLPLLKEMLTRFAQP
jgi:hypothetical protein